MVEISAASVAKLFPADLVEIITKQMQYPEPDIKSKEYAARKLILEIITWLNKDCRGLPLTDAHYTHVRYIAYLLTNGEPNQIGYNIDGYSKA